MKLVTFKDADGAELFSLVVEHGGFTASLEKAFAASFSDKRAPKDKSDMLEKIHSVEIVSK